MSRTARHPDSLTFMASVDLRAKAGGTPADLSIVAYTGGELLGLPGWGRPVAVDLAGLRIGNPVPVAIGHENSTTAVAGQVTVKSDGRQLAATGKLYRTPETANILELAANGHVWQASVGITPDADDGAVELVEAGEFVSINGRRLVAEGVGLFVVRRGQLREISIVAIGCDPHTSVSIKAKKGQNTMPTTAQPTSDAVAQERSRVKNINGTLAQYSGLADAAAIADLQTRAIDTGMTPADVQGELLALADALRRRGVQAAEFQMPAGIGRGRATDAASSRDVLAAATLQLVGEHDLAGKSYSEGVVRAASALGVTCALDLCRQAAMLEGASFSHGDKSGMIRAGLSTGSLPVALGDSAAKAIAQAYKDVPSTYDAIAARRPVSNFHEHSLVRPYLDGGEFAPVAPGGQLKHSAIGEAVITHQASTRGRIFSIDRTMIINDDIGVVFDLQRSLGQNARRTIANVFWTAIKDAASFFTSGNGNYLSGADSALSITSLGAAILAMREQADADGQPIDVMPAVLAVPPALEPTGRALLGSLELNRTGDSDPLANPWHAQLQLAVEPRLGTAAGGSDSAWYLFARPSTVPAAILSFLDGRDAPHVEQIQHTETLGVTYRAYMDFGADLGDYRGALKSKGEA